MERKKSFFISAALVVLAGCFSLTAWFTYTEPSSVVAMVIASVLFMAGVIVFALNFRE